MSAPTATPTASTPAPAGVSPGAATAVGWTPGRARRSWWFITALAVAAVAAVWAMLLPWAGLKLGEAPATCVIGERGSTISTYNEQREVVTVSASGCISAYQSVHPEKSPGATASTPAGGMPTAASPSITSDGSAPLGSPKMAVRMGIPSMTFWLVASAALGALALATRYSLLMVPCIVLMNTSNSAFTAHRSALSWGLHGYVEEMRGVEVHQYAFAGTAIVLLAGFLFLVKVNAEQRKLDTAAYEAGERENPPRMVFAQLVGSYLLRGNLEKLSGAAAAAKEEAAAKREAR